MGTDSKETLINKWKFDSRKALMNCQVGYIFNYFIMFSHFVYFHLFCLFLFFSVTTGCWTTLTSIWFWTTPSGHCHHQWRCCKQTNPVLQQSHPPSPITGIPPPPEQVVIDVLFRFAGPREFCGGHRCRCPPGASCGAQHIHTFPGWLPEAAPQADPQRKVSSWNRLRVGPTHQKMKVLVARI